MRVLAPDLDVDRGAEAVGQRPEEVRHQLGRQPADGLATEASIEDRIRPAGQVDRDLRQCLVHRQHEAIAPDAALVAECRTQRLTECECAVLDRVVLVDAEVAGAGECQRETAVPGDLLEHVVEEADTR